MKNILLKLTTIAIFVVLNIPCADADGTWINYTNSNYVRSIIIQGDNVWYSTWGVLVRWNRIDGSYVKYEGTVEKTIRASSIGAGTENMIWVSHGTDDISIFNGSDWKHHVEKEFPFPEITNISKMVTMMVADKNKCIWTASNNGNVLKFEGDDWSNRTIYTPDDGLVSSNGIQSIAVDRNNVKWFGTSSGVSSFDGTEWKTYTTDDGLVKNNVTVIAVDRNNIKWFGTDRGVSSFDGTVWETYTKNDENGFLSNNILGIVVDSENNKWFATSKGISRFDGSSWITYTEENSDIPDNYIQALAVDSEDVLWLSTGRSVYNFAGNGLTWFDGTTWKNYRTEGPVYNIIRYVVVNNDNVKWFYTDLGVSAFDGISWTHYTTNRDSVWNEVKPVVTDQNGVQWFFRDGGGVKSFDGSSWAEYTVDDGLASNTATALTVDKNNVKWIGTDCGVSSFDGYIWKTYTGDNGFVSEEINVIAVDTDNQKWFGTMSCGLWSFDGSTWINYTINNSALKEDRVTDIVVDHNNVKWLLQFPPALQSFDDSVWKTYDGVDEYIPGQVLCMAVDQNNVMWFSTYDGGVFGYNYDSSDYATSIETSDTIPSSTEIFRNFPNPFNSETTIEFTLPNSDFVNMVVYNIAGQKVRTLVYDTISAGKHRVRWNGRNDLGVSLSSGVFFINLITVNTNLSQRIMYVK
ncbi:MAG: T9SS type A sorting domain-containing protein [Candidatus Latescibacteria bacterium]|nr:T9SS type A sorting domain-containing protein [Candidatus Latescibacterota bacterium]